MLKSFFRDGSNVAGMNMFVSLDPVPQMDFLLPQAACYNFSAFVQWYKNSD
jgi:hypothetical protein